MLSTPYTVTYSDHQIELCEYRKGLGGKDVTVIVPPQAGHTSLGIVDYGEEDDGRSLVKCALDNAPEDQGVYVINFKGATRARRNETYEDMAKQVLTACTKALGIHGKGQVHLVGLCQGGVLATAVVASVPILFSKLTIAGAPVDSEACESDLTEAIKKPMSQYKFMVDYGFEPFKNGLMSGNDMLMAWKSMNAKSHYFDRYVKILMGNNSGEKLYEWYDDVQDIAGPAYLYMIENIFKKNLLIKNQLPLFGGPVNLGNITCPVNVITGDSDTITPAAQSLSLFYKVGTEESTDLQAHSVKGGHLAVFNGKDGIKNIWPIVFS